MKINTAKIELMAAKQGMTETTALLPHSRNPARLHRTRSTPLWPTV